MAPDLQFTRLTTPKIRRVQDFLHAYASEDISFGQLLSFCINPNAEAFILKSDGAMVGFIGGSSDPERLHESRIDVLCVHADFRRRGLARELIARFVVAVSAKTCALEVRHSNKAAQLFYKRIGFNEAGIKERFYRNEDALVMQTQIE